uniref:Vesicle-fusing ATPase n=2 Tax=Pyramimonas obovata TaxID=1411642 RepID=A0A7S0S019_9CHLO|mmetsp:Transcript_9599/g.19893  ORF Transcript_9599/g.19893 Transcript_9599/m.19893 type:complete len:722 (+) Transcript_9599:123-2288(+)
MGSMRVTNCPSQDLALTNCLFCSPADERQLVPYCELGGCVFFVKPHPSVEAGCIALNAVQRKGARVSAGDVAQVLPFTPPSQKFASVMLTLELDFITRGKGKQEEVDAATLSREMVKRFSSQVFTVGQKVTFEYLGTNYMFNVTAVVVEGQLETDVTQRGMMLPSTTFMFETPANSGIKIVNQATGNAATKLFKQKEFNFEKLGIGGLDSQFEQIFRRAFSSRVFPPHIVEKLGIKHVKGMLLFGPPGTGKTLIARQIGKLLNAREPKVVNGPEVLNKYVGQSEENIRNLFKDAEEDQRANGDNSDLHIIIFDEMDAICKSRGSAGDNTGTRDSLVNQLLTKVDGVDALNNILLIGMTNRKDLLDEALMRPGRLEVQVEIGLPDERGRTQILHIHTAKMEGNQFLGRDVRVEELAAITKNFSGAEIEGLVKSATSFALNRQLDVNDLSAQILEENIKVTMADFEAALEEVKPAFGAAVDSLERCRLNGIIPYGPHFQHLMTTCRSIIQQVRTSEQTPLLTCLLEGPPGAGKSALAATLALESDFPFIKLVSAEAMVSMSAGSKVQMIHKVFEDAFKSPLSVILLDDIERLLEYAAIGPHFSNAILQTLLVLLKRPPPPGRRLLVFGTTSNIQVMEMLEVNAAFNVVLNVPLLKSEDTKQVLQHAGAFAAEEVEGAVAMLEPNMPIKRLLMLLEMARAGGGGGAGGRIALERWVDCIQDLNG